MTEHQQPAIKGDRSRLRPFDLESMAEAIRQFLLAAGIDVSDHHLSGTPERVASAWSREFLDGYETDPLSILEDSFDNESSNHEDASEIILAKDIAFHGLCPHHLLPFQGEAHIGYLPNSKLAPFSSLARLVDCFAHRLDVQEAITRDIAEALVIHLGAKGAGAVLESEQSCMTVRGVKRRGSRVVTTHFSGVLATRADLRRDFLRLVGKVD